MLYNALETSGTLNIITLTIFSNNSDYTIFKLFSMMQIIVESMTNLEYFATTFVILIGNLVSEEELCLRFRKKV